MSKYEIVFKIDTFPSSEKFRIFRVFNSCIWQIISPRAYNIDTGEIEYFDFIFDDMVTAEIISDYLNEMINISKLEEDREFEERTRKALDRVENDPNSKSYSKEEFLDILE